MTTRRKVELKTVNPHFSDVWNNLKRAELRFDDRDYSLNDILWLREYDELSETYSGRIILSLPTHILKDFEAGLKPNWVMISIIVVLKYNADGSINPMEMS